jgi:hypothetical protein
MKVMNQFMYIVEKLKRNANTGWIEKTLLLKRHIVII